MATDRKFKDWKPSEAEEEYLKDIREAWQSALSQKLDSYRHLGDRSVVQFQDDSRDQYNGYVPPWDDVDDEWKARFFKPRTRHKVMAALAEMLGSSLGLDFTAVNDDDSIDRQLARVADDVFEWSTYSNEPGAYKLFLAWLDAVVTGTAHVMDEIAWDGRTVQEITDIDPDTFEITSRKKEVYDHKGPKMTVVPNGEIYPGNVWEPDIQSQPYFIRRFVLPYARAEALYGNRPNWQYVAPGSARQLAGTGSSIYEQEMDDIEPNDVELVYYWDKPNDRMAIVANSILLTSANQPFPYPHKRYPFAKGVCETFADHRFYWGNSIPNVISGEQDAINELTRMFIDATKLKIAPPLFTNSEILASTDMIRPGMAAGLPDDFKVETIQEIAKGIGQSEFNVLQLLERQQDESTIDPLPAGKAPSGDPTATEVRAIVGAAQKQQDIQNLFNGHLLVQFAELRVSNSLWFLTKDRSLKEITREDVTVKGSRGRRRLRFVDASELPDPEQVLASEMKSKAKGDTVQYVYVDVGSIDTFRLHARISPTPKPPRSGPAKLLRAMTKYRIYAQNPLFDQEQNARSLAKAMGDDPDSMVKKPQGPMPAPQDVPEPQVTKGLVESAQAGQAL